MKKPLCKIVILKARLDWYDCTVYVQLEFIKEICQQICFKLFVYTGSGVDDLPSSAGSRIGSVNAIQNCNAQSKSA